MSEEIGQYSAVDMATAAAEGFRDGVASVANSEIPNNQDASAAHVSVPRELLEGVLHVMDNYVTHETPEEDELRALLNGGEA